jgi:hypothetical protein
MINQFGMERPVLLAQPELISILTPKLAQFAQKDLFIIQLKENASLLDHLSS